MTSEFKGKFNEYDLLFEPLHSLTTNNENFENEKASIKILKNNQIIKSNLSKICDIKTSDGNLIISYSIAQNYYNN